MTKRLLALTAVALVATQSLGSLPNQLATTEPPPGSDTDHGPYSVQDQTLGAADPWRAIAYDNFSISSSYNITGIDWVGIYSEPLPLPASDTDFIVQIWGDSSGVPDISSPLHTFTFEGGATAGLGGADLTVTANGDVSSSTSTTIGGGPGFDYSGTISSTLLTAGDYWISIIADQRFDNPTLVDPEWQWHTGTGPGDGFYAYDATLDPVGSPEYGILQPDKDLAFAIRGSLVPEPQSAIMILMGLSLAGLVRHRNRSLPTQHETPQ